MTELRVHIHYQPLYSKIVESNGMVAVNLDSAHNAKIMSKLDESQIIDMLRLIIEDAIPEIGYYHVSAASKSDDDWFFEIWKK